MSTYDVGMIVGFRKLEYPGNGGVGGLEKSLADKSRPRR